jgi:Cu+-exporting ATPase
MIGDGLNDAGALLEADAGITVADDVYHFSPACDGIIHSEKFSLIPELLKLSHSSLKVVFISYGISFLYNIIGVSFAISGNLSPIIAAILMPVSSVSVVAFTTISIAVISKKRKF